MLNCKPYISSLSFLVSTSIIWTVGENDTCVTCPTNDTIPSVNINYNSNPLYVTIAINGCPPYDWSQIAAPYPACTKDEMFLIPKTPIPLEIPIEIGMISPISGPIGIFLNGVKIFSPATAIAEDAVLQNWESLDDCLSLVSPHGEHHGYALVAEVEGEVYTYAERCGLPEDSSPITHSPLFGMLFDGYGLYGQHNGYPFSLIPLDACNGHTHFIDGEDVYHYHITKTYPYTIDCYHGCPQIDNFGLEQLTHLSGSELCEFLAPEDADSILGGILNQISDDLEDNYSESGRTVCVFGWSRIDGITCNLLTGIILCICLFVLIVLICIACFVAYGQKRAEKETANVDEKQPMVNLSQRQFHDNMEPLEFAPPRMPQPMIDLSQRQFHNNMEGLEFAHPRMHSYRRQPLYLR